MIGTIDVKVQAHNPNFPLDPVFTFVNSSQSFRIRDVPKRIGNWSITNVFVNVTYPNNTVISKECVLTGGVWVGTVDGCSTSGEVENGFVVTASGIDENNQTVSNYVLGAGNIYVKELDGTVTPGTTAARMYFYETLPTTPNEGDTTFIEGVLNVYDGTQWKPAAEQLDPSYIEDTLGNKINANKTFIERLSNNQTSWKTTINNVEYTLNWSSYSASFGDKWMYTGEQTEGLLTLQIEHTNHNVWFFAYLINGVPQKSYINDSPDNATQLIFLNTDFGDCIFNRTIYVNGKLASIDEIPTKTSDLTNDSGFITSAYVHGDYIENTDGDKISANRNYEFNRPLTYSWTLNYSLLGQEVQLNWNDEFGFWFYEGSNYKPSSPRMERVALFYYSSDDTWQFYSDHYDESIQDWVENDDESETTAPEDSENISFSNGASISRTLSGSGTLALTSEIPTKTSDLTNDSNFVTTSQIPTKTSDLTNDSGFITVNEVPTPSYIEDIDGNKINANRSALIINSHFWSLNGGTNFTGTKTNSVYESDATRMTLEYSNGYWSFEHFTWTGYEWYLIYTNAIQGSESDNQLTFDNEGGDDYIFNWTPQTSNATLALTSQIPTKTSDLTNDSGFITSSYPVKNDGGITKAKAMTEQAYEALQTKDSTTLYVITEN